MAMESRTKMVLELDFESQVEKHLISGFIDVAIMEVDLCGLQHGSISILISSSFISLLP